MADTTPLQYMGEPEGLEEGADSTVETTWQPRRLRPIQKAGLAVAGLLGAGVLGAAAVASRAGRPATASSIGAGALQLQGVDATDIDDIVPVGGDAEPLCSNAVKGDTCFENVVWSMTTGINKHPEWYKGLTKKSLFEEFQAQVHEESPKKCPAPCIREGCETAKPGSACYQSAMWAMTEGIGAHPSWYKGLTPDSPFEDFQENVHGFNKTLCPMPCNPQPFKVVLLFCWAVMRPAGPELDLMKMQLSKRAGLFACDDFALVSDQATTIGDGPHGPVSTIGIGSTQVAGYTNDGTSPNAPIFVRAWDAISSVAAASGYGWIVKVDPDTVLVPDRLRMILTPGNTPKNPYPTPYATPASTGQFVTNCDKMANWGAGWGNGWPMMYGSFEILSRAAMETYFANVDNCKGSMPWQGMGEDAFMGLCLRHLKVGELFIKQGDAMCDHIGAPCTDKTKAAFHPKKSTAEWMQCWTETQR